MGPNSMLPALVTALIVIIVASLGAGFALAWETRPRIRQLVRRLWLAVTVLSVAGVGIFWIGTAMVSRPGLTTVDRGMQTQQQGELHKRLQDGGH
ncbi:MAG TPA: hypothetical protein VMU01_11950 [Rhizomicrobium sp.]|nr:hypothetical protein [Rhizomicrobium sp.]